MGKKIWIKANGNGIIATGHIRRCMTIAQELKALGAEVEFVLSDEDSANLLQTLSDEEDIQYDARILHTVFSEPMQDIEVLEEMIADEKPDFYLMDSYFLKEDYFDAINDIIKKNNLSTKTGFIDDLYKFDYPVDLVVNYDIEIPKDFYSAPHKLLGAKYAPLRKQFEGIDYDVIPIAKRAFLSAGGTDPYHIVGSLLKEVYENDGPCRKIPDFMLFTCDVIVGALFEEDYVKELKELAAKYPAITLHESTPDMAGLMKSCDFAVTAGGTTLYELCAVGVPTVVYSMADNQVEFVKAFDKSGAVKYAGDLREDDRIVQRIVAWGIAAIDNQEFRKKMSDKARKLVDGGGANKIARAILEII
ncbi:UDP-2,4-diacetamido-2,4,6-trideoxy-beta-L-altropyranose hydrolase [Butyrivibrio sp. INlla21]|uniref:UDP-2,4-diacetamido-2,4, 6-trideoxy-beta-L-altropyranose hydrolase n=1 Tax=Butyrivibrio sp. INlla21 TaxID=1520811 RepID=UPI0008DEE3AD|nr:UDP-2,4-diacetamido-2,4,6-trideoxy-beta-L-altropyranose hydrolase [Butyrivibrio sp. INlla21]SFU67833.1 UDP-2,4-diacetamido-2,4,6-trideoxy-beta-L-altropyranose hydrolase [Butyrivibrio sp. INlla21]